tara:strand:+ start:1618 stop:1941 length:324 start_codon:yes stop_codon:yes gene_type:complete
MNNKRKRDNEDAGGGKRMHIEHSAPDTGLAGLKRSGEALYGMAKRMRVESIEEEIVREIARLHSSLAEMQTNQRTCYQIMAGQAARIRQLEQHRPPQNHPWVAQWVK